MTSRFAVLVSFMMWLIALILHLDENSVAILVWITLSQSFLSVSASLVLLLLSHPYSIHTLDSGASISFHLDKGSARDYRTLEEGAEAQQAAEEGTCMGAFRYTLSRHRYVDELPPNPHYEQISSTYFLTRTLFLLCVEGGNQGTSTETSMLLERGTGRESGGGVRMTSFNIHLSFCRCSSTACLFFGYISNFCILWDLTLYNIEKGKGSTCRLIRRWTRVRTTPSQIVPRRRLWITLPCLSLPRPPCWCASRCSGSRVTVFWTSWALQLHPYRRGCEQGYVTNLYISYLRWHTSVWIHVTCNLVLSMIKVDYDIYILQEDSCYSLS